MFCHETVKLHTLTPLVRLCIEMDMDRLCVSCSDTSVRRDHIRMMSCSPFEESITAINGARLVFWTARAGEDAAGEVKQSRAREEQEIMDDRGASLAALGGDAPVAMTGPPTCTQAPRRARPETGQTAIAAVPVDIELFSTLGQGHYA